MWCALYIRSLVTLIIIFHVGLPMTTRSCVLRRVEARHRTFLRVVWDNHFLSCRENLFELRESLRSDFSVRGELYGELDEEVSLIVGEFVYGHSFGVNALHFRVLDHLTCGNTTMEPCENNGNIILTMAVVKVMMMIIKWWWWWW